MIKEGHLFRLISPYEDVAEVSSYYYADKEENAERILLSYLQSYPYQKRDISWRMDLLPQKVDRLRMKAADVKATYLEVLSGKYFSGADLQNGIQIRMSESGKFGKLMLFEKQ